jgi:hypothetical protein
LTLWLGLEEEEPTRPIISVMLSIIEAVAENEAVGDKVGLDEMVGVALLVADMDVVIERDEEDVDVSVIALDGVHDLVAERLILVVGAAVEEAVDEMDSLPLALPVLELEILVVGVGVMETVDVVVVDVVIVLVSEAVGLFVLEDVCVRVPLTLTDGELVEVDVKVGDSEIEAVILAVPVLLKVVPAVPVAE